MIDLQIQALLKNTSAEILSKPSVLVLDGRQARIQVGEQIPISKLPISNSEDNFLVPDIEYLPTGITLNLRPRISEDNKNVTMQIETIITEALNELDEEYGTERLLNVWKDIDLTGKQAVSAILRDVEEFSGDMPQLDDQTLMVISSRKDG